MKGSIGTAGFTMNTGSYKVRGELTARNARRLAKKEKRHDDAREDKKLVKKMVKGDCLK